MPNLAAIRFKTSLDIFSGCLELSNKAHLTVLCVTCAHICSIVYMLFNCLLYTRDAIETGLG